MKIIEQHCNGFFSLTSLFLYTPTNEGSAWTHVTSSDQWEDRIGLGSERGERVWDEGRSKVGGLDPVVVSSSSKLENLVYAASAKFHYFEILAPIVR